MDKILRLIGLARRANNVRPGSFICEKLIRDKKAPLVVIASDGSPDRIKKLENLCLINNASYIKTGTKKELGKLLGKEEILCLVVTDRNIINGINKELEDNGGA